MSENTLLERTFNIIMNRLVEPGQAPHYTEIAADLGVSMEEGRKTIHDLFSAGVSGWLFPDTDLIASLAPFNNPPTSIESPLTVIKNGSLNEDLKRWQLAGYSQGKRSESISHVWIVVYRAG